MSALRISTNGSQLSRLIKLIDPEKFPIKDILRNRGSAAKHCNPLCASCPKWESASSIPVFIPMHEKNYFKKQELITCSKNIKSMYSTCEKDDKNQKKNSKQLPRLLYIQNPLVWFSNKLDFRFLRNNWDPQFTESEFTRGARQAISLVTQLLSKSMFESMKTLLTKNALLNLRRDVEILWADEVRRNIALRPEDVQLIIPRKIHFRHISNAPSVRKLDLDCSKKFCDIDMVFIGLKWVENYNLKNPPLLFIDIIARFHRNYTEGINPEWTISAFRVRRFNLIPSKKQ